MTLYGWLKAHRLKPAAVVRGTKGEVSASSVSRFLNGYSRLTAKHMQEIVRWTAEIDPSDCLTIDDLIREGERRVKGEEARA